MTMSAAGASLHGPTDRSSLVQILRHALAVVVVAVLVVIVSRWLDRYLILDDDTERGQNYRYMLERTVEFSPSYTGWCQSAAEDLYGEPIYDPPPYGNPTPAEKAFFHACSGITVGGYGGGSDNYGD